MKRSILTFSLSLLLSLANECLMALEPIPDKLVVLGFDDCNKSDRHFVAGVLKKHGFGATFYVTEGLGFHSGKGHYITWEEIRQLHKMGFEIGNHTKSHPNVTRLSREQL
ncbi:MAG: polysaccharide deacetylase family protein, partial [Verrucomicrobiaceae bacterium]|nr:polysaccharide deacetylase family protein [Verrucomicrobiaceae bacterium]